VEVTLMELRALDVTSRRVLARLIKKHRLRTR
jgi:hypothetical protein